MYKKKNTSTKSRFLIPWHDAGKQWHAPKKAFRPGSGLTSYEKRAKDRVALAAMKAKEKEMKEEKEEVRQVRATITTTLANAGPLNCVLTCDAFGRTEPDKTNQGEARG